ncbi:ABC transporter substrate-binding protein [Bradyrhizobium vignae]|uniref:SsuA/THI5-like domain-containing protein n=1 Tax=Bradyrhizobium vignae TaxID=1549949 RepID=A0A2U3PUT4_9BRAD|nr:ABC transporter substrate-binding protein [Bradyrhizobium vignae]SPP92927.1 exported protein of unknown function [Bradyrhizobium vignae]
MGGRLVAVLTAMAVMWTSSANAMEKYVVQNAAPVPGAPFLDVYAAQRLGFFSDEALQVEMRHSANASQALQLAASGAADVARTTFEPYLAGYEQGVRGKFYMQNYAHNIFFFAVPKASNIEKVEDLRNKKIGVVDIGAGGKEIARSMLKLAGLPYDNSVFLPVGTGPSALQALANGSVSALFLWDSAYSALERQGAEFRYYHHPVVGFVGNAGFFISDSSLKNRREAHIRFLRAIVRARLWISQRPDEAVQIYWDAVPNSRFGKATEQQRANSLKEIGFMNPYPPGLSARDQGRFDFEALEKYMRVMKEEGGSKQNLGGKDVCSNELLDQIGAIDIEKTVNVQYKPSN